MPQGPATEAALASEGAGSLWNFYSAANAPTSKIYVPIGKHPRRVSGGDGCLQTCGTGPHIQPMVAAASAAHHK
jgi:hypothetical protein